MSGISPPSLPRRILMSVDAVGGVWRYAMDLATSLSERGLEVVFACFGPPASQARIAEAERIGRFVAVAAPLDWTARDEGELSAVAPALARLTAELEIDLLHLNLPSQAAGLEVPVPVAVVSHSCVVSWFRAVRGTDTPPDWQWQGRWNRAGFAAADAIISPSRSHAELLTACYGPLHNLQVVHNGAAAAPTEVEREPFVLSAGRWWDDGKNGRVLDAAASGARWPVLMAGSNNGPNGQYVPIEHARYLGEMAHRELRDLMSRAGVFVSPSLYEPFGLAALEAGAAGTPLLLADIPTYRELWQDAALFFRPDDADALSAALDRLAGDPALRAELGRNARTRAATYSLDAQADAVCAIYSSFIQPSTALLRAG